MSTANTQLDAPTQPQVVANQEATQASDPVVQARDTVTQASYELPHFSEKHLKPLPPELHPNIDHIVTEDGAPVDNICSEKQRRLLTEPLYSCWRPNRQFAAMANVGLFFALHEPPFVPDIRHEPPFVPDIMVSLDVRIPNDMNLKKIARTSFGNTESHPTS